MLSLGINLLSHQIGMSKMASKAQEEYENVESHINSLKADLDKKFPPLKSYDFNVVYRDLPELEALKRPELTTFEK